MNITRKLKLYVVGDAEEKNRVYKYLREGITSQNKAMNQYIVALYVAELKDITKEDRKELNNLYGRISSSKKGSAYSENIQFAKGLSTTSSIGQKVKSDFKKQLKDGLMNGKVSLATYRKDNPLLIHVDWIRLRNTNPHRDFGMYHNYKNHTEFLEHLHSNDFEVFIKFANNITFGIVLKSPRKSHEIRCVLKEIFEEYYKICGSSIQIDDKDIILNLCIDIPEEEKELDENVVVGVDLGQAIPAMCALNNNFYERKKIGDVKDFLKVRTQMQHQRKRINTRLTTAKGGHGRKRKLKALDKFKNYESNYVKTYNHMVSKNVVDFALKNRAKYINLEDLSGFGKNKSGKSLDDDRKKKILRNWSYYQLQQYITYKASRYGIEVRKINPAYTSQYCSVCGSQLEGQRKSQSEFVCGNPNCKSHNLYKKNFNADFNAARNIAMSTNFITKNKEEEDV